MKLIQIKPLETHKQSYKKEVKGMTKSEQINVVIEVVLPKRRGKTNWFLEGDKRFCHKSNKNQ